MNADMNNMVFSPRIIFFTLLKTLQTRLRMTIKHGLDCFFLYIYLHKNKYYNVKKKNRTHPPVRYIFELNRGNVKKLKLQSKKKC